MFALDESDDEMKSKIKVINNQWYIYNLMKNIDYSYGYSVLNIFSDLLSPKMKKCWYYQLYASNFFIN